LASAISNRRVSDQVFRDPEVALQTYTAATPRPDLLITDYAMHTMNGMELIEQFRRLNLIKRFCSSAAQWRGIFETSQQADRFRPSRTKPSTRPTRQKCSQGVTGGVWLYRSWVSCFQDRSGWRLNFNLTNLGQ